MLAFLVIEHRVERGREFGSRSTAAGLSVAIPAYIAYLFFVSRVDRLIIEIDAHGQRVVNLISAEALAEALAAVERLLLLDSEEVREIRDRGILMAHLGRPGAAVADLEAYLGLAPGAPDADSVRGRLAWLRRKLSEAN